jgi:hypothetical protein
MEPSGQVWQVNAAGGEDGRMIRLEDLFITGDA